MSNYMYHFGNGVFNYPYALYNTTFNLIKILAPKVYFTKHKSNNYISDIELNSNVNKKLEKKNYDDCWYIIERDKFNRLHQHKIDIQQSYEIVLYDKKLADKIIEEQQNEEYWNNYKNLIPEINIALPNMYDISTRVLFMAAYEIPNYTFKSFNNSPIFTLIALYHILPNNVWVKLVPKVFYYLPRLIF